MLEEKEKEIKDELKKLAYMYELNSVIRYGLSRDEEHKTQSLSEHVTNILTCAHFFKDIISDGHLLDMGVVARRALVHDIGEIETGDILTVKKNEDDTKREHVAIATVIDKAPSSITKQLMADFEAVEFATDLEGRFVRAMDKFDGFFFQGIGDGIRMIRVVTPDIEIRRKYLDSLENIMENLSFPEITPYVRVAVDDLIQRGYLRNTE